MFDQREEPSALERDVLLASSGELPWWRRPALRLRLWRDARARALASTLRLLDETVSVRGPAPARRRRRVWVVALPVAVIAWWTLRPSFGPESEVRPELAAVSPAPGLPRPSEPPDGEHADERVPEPEHVALARLVIATTRVGRVSSGWSDDWGDGVADDGLAIDWGRSSWEALEVR